MSCFTCIIPTTNKTLKPRSQLEERTELVCKKRKVLGSQGFPGVGTAAGQPASPRAWEEGPSSALRREHKGSEAGEMVPCDQRKTQGRGQK